MPRLSRELLGIEGILDAISSDDGGQTVDATFS